MALDCASAACDTARNSTKASGRMLSVLRRKASVSPCVGLLARRGQRAARFLFALRAACRFTFPSRVLSGCFVVADLHVGLAEATRPRSQWRNRAGLAPDFPVMPLVGTQGT